MVIWDISTSSWKRHVIPTDAKERFSFVSFTADSRELLTIKSDIKGAISVQHWDVNKRIKTNNSTTKSFGDYAEILQVSPVGQTVIRYGNFGEEGSKVSLLNSDLNEINITKEENGFEVREVVFSSSGKRLAIHGVSPSRRSLYGIFVFDTFAEKHQLVELHEDFVFSRNFKNLTSKLALSDNGEFLAIGFDNGIRVLDLDKNVAIKEIPLEFSSSGTVSMTSNGSLLAVNDVVKTQNSSSNDNRLTLWSLGSQSEVFTFEEMKPIVNCADCLDVITDDGSKLVAQDSSGAWILWDTFGRKKIATITPGAVNSGQERVALFSPTGEYFFTLITDNSGSESLLGNQLRIWDTTTGKELDLSSRTNCRFISNPVFWSDKDLVAVACKEGFIGIWHTKSGEKIKDIKIADRGNSLQLDLTQNNKIIAVTEQTIGVDYYDFESGAAIQPDQFSLKIQSPDNKWLVYGNKSSGYFLKDLLNESSIPVLLLEPLKFQSAAISFSRDSKLLQVFGVGEDVLTKPKLFTKNMVTMEDIKSESSEGADSFKVSPQNSWLIEKTKLRIYYSNIKTGMKNILSQCPENPTFSFDEKRLITSCLNGTIKFWDLLSGQEVLSIKAHQNEVKSLFLSKDEKHMLTVSETDAKLWRIKF